MRIKETGDRYRLRRVTLFAFALFLFCASASDAGVNREVRIRDGAVVYVLQPGVARNDVETVRRPLRTALAALEKDFPEVKRAPLVVRLTARTGDFTVQTGEPWWHGGIYEHGEMMLQPVATLEKRGVLESTLRHEAAHFALESVAGDRLPLWLVEGYCSTFSGELQPSATEMKQWLLGAASVAAIDSGMKQTNDMKRAEIAYRAAYVFVSTLQKNYGSARLINVIRIITKGEKPDAAFKSVFGTTPDRLLRRSQRDT